MEYIFQGKLDNQVHDITYDHIRLLYEDNRKEAEESREITVSSYNGENYYQKYGDNQLAFTQEYLLRDPKTAGTRTYYPHGIIIEQSQRRNYYRGENQIYPSSIPSLIRSLKQYKTIEERELYRLVADMRVAEFSSLIRKFQHVQKWKESDVLYEPIAQHYGLETGWLDITSDFNVALFFATCYWDGKQWLPLTRKQTEVDEEHQYGMIFHMPSNRMSWRWDDCIEKLKPWTDEPAEDYGNGKIRYGKLDYPIYRGKPKNIIYPLGFQPFMRCHMQTGYGIYMRNSQALQEDREFEKLRFRHSEKLSQRVFDIMDEGKLVYPHEGLKEVDFLIDQIRKETVFSEESFRYALYRSHYYRVNDFDKVLEDLDKFDVDGKKIKIQERHNWKISSGRKVRIDNIYKDFSIQKWYGIKIVDRQQSPEPSPFFEPWMYPDQDSGEGVRDFQLRENIGYCNSIVTRNAVSDLFMLMTQRLSDF